MPLFVLPFTSAFCILISKSDNDFFQTTMGKKDKGEHMVVNRETFQRMNFLYQAAMYMATIHMDPTHVDLSSMNATATTSATSSVAPPLSVSPTAAQLQPFLSESSTLSESTLNAVASSCTRALPAVATTVSLEQESPQLSKDADDRPQERVQEQPLLQRPIPPLSDNMYQPNTSMAANRCQGSTANRKARRAAMRAEFAATGLGSKRRKRQKIAAATLSSVIPGSSFQQPGQILAKTSRFYVATLKEIGRKNVIRMDPMVKRTFCKRCEALLIPSISATVRLEAKPQLNTLVECNTCGWIKRLYCMPGKGVPGDQYESTADLETNSPPGDPQVADKKMTLATEEVGSLQSLPHVT